MMSCDEFDEILGGIRLNWRQEMGGARVFPSGRQFRLVHVDSITGFVHPVRENMIFAHIDSQEH